MPRPQPVPLPQEPADVPVPGPVPVPPSPRSPSGPGPLLTAGLCLIAAAATALAVWLASGSGGTTSSGQPTIQMRTAVAESGELVKALRLGGTVETLHFAAIRTPKMRGPRDSGRADLTLAKLAEPGTIVPAGSVIAEFELRWLEDHIEDRESIRVQVHSNMRKRESEILILKETERQSRLNAKAEYDKALLDLRTAEVRSEIEAEVLLNLANEMRATWKQLEHEGTLMERVHAADIEGEKLKVKEEDLHVGRHQRDYERLHVQTPIPGMVVLETMFNKSGQFAQVKPGDQVYPGALFMRIVDVSKMVVSASVNQVDAQLIRIGSRAEVELDAYPGERFSGRVVDMGAVASSNGGGAKFSRGGIGAFIKRIPVRVLIEDSDERILPDLSASADVVISSGQSGVLIAREAVRADPDGEGADFVVLVDEEGSYRKQAVSVLDASDTHALIGSGLQPGEEVLLSELVQPLGEVQ